MTADGTYGPKVYRRQGGNVQVVASGGEILVESGGVVTIEAGGSIKYPVVTETTATALANSGVSTLQRGTTATGANAYTMNAPVAGVQKWLNVLTATVSEHVLVQGNTNVTFDGGAGTKTTLKIVAPGLIPLIGVSTSAWALTGVSTIVAFATS